MSNSAFSISSAVGERRRTAGVADGVGAGAAPRGRVEANILRCGNVSNCRPEHEFGEAK